MSAHFPSAPLPTRIVRSRRDDDFEMGHATPYKHAGAGRVISVQHRTVTVLVLDEELSGVIPLQGTPSVGDFVEVEARGQLLVIPIYTDGPPALGGWYFTRSESPGWEEGPSGATEQNEHVWNPGPSGPGLLWNEAVWPVSPGDELTFTMDVSQLDPSSVATVQLVYNWAAAGIAPHSGNGEVVGYGAIIAVDGADIYFERTVTVPDTFDKPTGQTLVPGAARVGLRYEMAGV